MGFTMNATNEAISLGAVVHTLRRRWRLFALTLMVPPLAALAFLLWVPSQYEAIAIVKIGRAGTQNMLIEPPTTVAARLCQKSYQEIALQRSKYRDRALVELYSAGNDSIRCRVMGGTELVEIRAEHPDKQLALAAVEAITDSLINEHRDFSNPFLKLAVDELSRVERRLGLLNAARDQLWVETTSIPSRDTDPNRTIGRLVVSQGLVVMSSEISTLQSRRFTLEEQIYSLRNNTTTRAIPSYASDRAVAPKRGKWLAIAALIGLVCSVVALLFVDAYPRPS